MPFRFETEWIEADGIRGSELSAAWASLLIGVDDEIVEAVLEEAVAVLDADDLDTDLAGTRRRCSGGRVRRLAVAGRPPAPESRHRTNPVTTAIG